MNHLSSRLLYCWSASPIPITTFQDQVSNSSISKPVKYIQISTLVHEVYPAMNSDLLLKITKKGIQYKQLKVCKNIDTLTFASTRSSSHRILTSLVMHKLVEIQKHKINLATRRFAPLSKRNATGLLQVRISIRIQPINTVIQGLVILTSMYRAYTSYCSLAILIKEERLT